MLRIVPVLCAVALAASIVVPVQATTRLPMRTAKLRTFSALLRETLKPPDSADATHAAITVGSCRRRTTGWLCHGQLAPVAFSGIDGSVCTYTIAVYLHSTRLSGADCADPAITPVPTLR